MSEDQAAGSRRELQQVRQRRDIAAAVGDLAAGDEQLGLNGAMAGNACRGGKSCNDLEIILTVDENVQTVA